MAMEWYQRNSGRPMLLLGCMIFVVLWSSGWIGAKFGQEFAGTFTLLVPRYALVVIILVALVSLTRSWCRVPPNQLACHIVIGILSHAVYIGTATSAIDMGVSAGMVAFITALQPLTTAVLSNGVSGERTSHRQWIGLVLGFSAVMLVISDKVTFAGSMFAFALPFLAILAISLASLLDRRISLVNQANRTKTTPLLLVCLIHCSAALVVFIPAAYLFEGFEIRWGMEVVFAIMWLAIMVSLGAYGLMFYLLRSLSATRVSSLEYLAPPTTMLLAYFAFGERLALIDTVGLLLAGGAVWLVLRESATRPVTKQALQHPELQNRTAPANGNLNNATPAAASLASPMLYRQSSKFKTKVNRFKSRRDRHFVAPGSYAHFLSANSR